MTRRVSLPGADELFRSTGDVEPAPAPSLRLRRTRTAQRLPCGRACGRAAARRAPTASSDLPAAIPRRGRRWSRLAPRPIRRRRPAGADRRPSGRERHDEKITVYVSPRSWSTSSTPGWCCAATHGSPSTAAGSSARRSRCARRPRGQGRAEHPGPPAARDLTGALLARRHPQLFLLLVVVCCLRGLVHVAAPAAGPVPGPETKWLLQRRPGARRRSSTRSRRWPPCSARPRGLDAAGGVVHTPWAASGRSCMLLLAGPVGQRWSSASLRLVGCATGSVLPTPSAVPTSQQLPRHLRRLRPAASACAARMNYAQKGAAAASGCSQLLVGGCSAWCRCRRSRAAAAVPVHARRRSAGRRRSTSWPSATSGCHRAAGPHPARSSHRAAGGLRRGRDRPRLALGITAPVRLGSTRYRRRHALSSASLRRRDRRGRPQSLEAPSAGLAVRLTSGVPGPPGRLRGAVRPAALA